MANIFVKPARSINFVQLNFVAVRTGVDFEEIVGTVGIRRLEMAILGVDDFKSKLQGGGARPNLFNCKVNFPAYALGDAELTSFMARVLNFLRPL